MTQLPHFNWGTMKASFTDPLVAEFFDGVAKVNAVAERSPGFVWRHGNEYEEGQAIDWPLFMSGQPVIASFSVWEDEGALRHFVHKTVHGIFFRRGAEWFDHGLTYGNVIWPIAKGHIPTIKEARDKVARLDREGPGPDVRKLGAPSKFR